MANLLHTCTLANLPPCNPLDVLDHLCRTTAGDIVLLQTADGAGRSVLAWDPFIAFSIDAEGAPTITTATDWPIPPLPTILPLQALQHLIAAVPFNSPHPLVGWLGFISYDIARTLESIATWTDDDLRWPLLHWSLFQNYLVFDHAAQTLTAHTLGHPPADPAALSTTASSAMRDERSKMKDPPVLLPGQSPESFRTKVRKVQDYIAAGDIYQANLAQRWIVRTPDPPQPPHQIFRNLCRESPAPYAAFLRFTSPDGIPRHVLSASPELFLSVADGHIMTRPIKGTRPRDRGNAARDQALRDELSSSAKDQAELAMIVDLLRNDLGRVGRYGSVRVSEPRAIEKHPTVWHTAATIEADLRPEAQISELFAAVCPGGSITGAPKIRAMQIIEELEGFRRGLYCGNIGLIAPDACSMTLNIAIRTILMQEDRAYIYAGGGIVADSDPQLELEETHHKAAAMFRALGLPFPA
jgi:anthranilate/para-aminobenzoate synthase component I